MNFPGLRSDLSGARLPNMKSTLPEDVQFIGTQEEARNKSNHYHQPFPPMGQKEIGN